MSTPKSIDQYFTIRGIQDEVTLLQGDSQDYDFVREHVFDPSVDVSEYGSFFVYSVPGEIQLIWGVSPHWMYVDLIYSARQLHNKIARRNKARKNAR